MKPFHYESLKEKKRLLIVDTDIGADCDDAGAMAVLFRLVKDYEFPCAVINCTPDRSGSLAVAAIAESRGVKSPLLGQAERAAILEDDRYHVYDRILAEEFREKYPVPAIEESISLYLRLLRDAPDGGVIWVPIGPLHQLAAVWRDHPELVRRKVYAVVCMGGVYGNFETFGHREYNLRMAADATKIVFEEFPCPIICIGLEIGQRIPSGFVLPDRRDPVNRAYEIHTRGKMLRPSWDPLTVLFAIEGEGKRFSLSAPGINRITPDGSNYFTEDPSGRHFYITEKLAPVEISTYLEQLYRYPAETREERKE